MSSQFTSLRRMAWPPLKRKGMRFLRPRDKVVFVIILILIALMVRLHLSFLQFGNLFNAGSNRHVWEKVYEYDRLPRGSDSRGFTREEKGNALDFKKSHDGEDSLGSGDVLQTKKRVTDKNHPLPSSVIRNKVDRFKDLLDMVSIDIIRIAHKESLKSDDGKKPLFHVMCSCGGPSLHDQSQQKLCEDALWNLEAKYLHEVIRENNSTKEPLPFNFRVLYGGIASNNGNIGAKHIGEKDTMGKKLSEFVKNKVKNKNKKDDIKNHKADEVINVNPFFGDTSDAIRKKIMAHAESLNAFSKKKGVTIPSSTATVYKDVDEYFDNLHHTNNSLVGNATSKCLLPDMKDLVRGDGYDLPIGFNDKESAMPNNNLQPHFKKTESNQEKEWNIRYDFHIICAAQASRTASWERQMAFSRFLRSFQSSFLREFSAPRFSRIFYSPESVMSRLISQSATNYLLIDPTVDIHEHSCPPEVKDENIIVDGKESEEGVNSNQGGNSTCLDSVYTVLDGIARMRQPVRKPDMFHHMVDQSLDGNTEASSQRSGDSNTDECNVSVIKKRPNQLPDDESYDLSLGLRAVDDEPSSQSIIRLQCPATGEQGTNSAKNSLLPLGAHIPKDGRRGRLLFSSSPVDVERCLSELHQTSSQLPLMCSDVKDPRDGITFSKVLKSGTKTGVYKGVFTHNGENKQYAIKHFSAVQYTNFLGFSKFIHGYKRSSLIHYPTSVCYDKPNQTVFQLQPFIDKGKNLKQLDKKSLSWAHRIEIALQIACIFEYFHFRHPSGKVFTFDDNHPEQYVVRKVFTSSDGDGVQVSDEESDKNDKRDSNFYYEVRLVDIDTIQEAVRPKATNQSVSNVSRTKSYLSLHKTRCRCFHCGGRSNCMFINTLEGYRGCGQVPDVNHPTVYSDVSNDERMSKKYMSNGTSFSDMYKCDATSDVWFQAQLFYYLIKGELFYDGFTHQSIVSRLIQVEDREDWKKSLSKSKIKSLFEFVNRMVNKGVLLPTPKSSDTEYNDLIIYILNERPEEYKIIPILQKLCKKYNCGVTQCPADVPVGEVAEPYIDLLNVEKFN